MNVPVPLKRAVFQRGGGRCEYCGLSQALSAAEVRVALGHESRWETEDFLAAHDAWPGTAPEQVAEEGRKLNALLSR